MTAVDADIIDADNWPLFAACRGMDPDLFFPTKGESNEVAKATCAGCPVAEPCLEAGMVGAARNFGIWGGTSVRERRHIARARRPSSDAVSQPAAAPRTAENAAAMGIDGPAPADPVPASRPRSRLNRRSLTASAERCPESRSRDHRHERRRTPPMPTKRNTTKPATNDTGGRSKSTITKDGTITCTGACGETLPETKFPTIRNAEGVYVRRDECRACQDARRAAARSAKAKASKK